MDEQIMEPLEDQVPVLDPDTPLTVVDVMFRSGGKVYYFDPGDLDVPANTYVIIDTSRGVEFGTCTASNHTVRAADVVMPLRKVIRLATPNDERLAEENRAKEADAFDICLQKIAESGLDMQLVSAEYAFDGSKILFFFTADGRVDFRELVKSLAAVFRTRIELRQIGVRDKAKMVGGLGVCGRPFCCSEFLDDFQPVSIKMAKVQNLSLNPAKISGTCGRLMCCLKYEQDAYEDLIRTSPLTDSLVDTKDGRGTITEVNLLRQTVKVRMEEHPEDIRCYSNCDVCVLRSGKAHKNAMPVPKEVAPLSGEQEYKPKLRSTASFLQEHSEKPVTPRNGDTEPEEKPVRRKNKPAKDLPAPAEKPEKPQEQHRRKGKPRPDGEKPKIEKAQKPSPEGSKPKPSEKPQKLPRTDAEKIQKPHKGGEKPNKPHHKGPKNVHPDGEKQKHSAEKAVQIHVTESDSKPKPNRPHHRRKPSHPKSGKPQKPEKPQA